MEIATILIAISFIFLFWGLLRKIITGLESSAESMIASGTIYTGTVLAGAIISEVEKASEVVTQLGYSVKDEAVVPVYHLILAIRKADPSNQKKLAEELRLLLIASAQTPTPTPAPTPAP